MSRRRSAGMPTPAVSVEVMSSDARPTRCCVRHSRPLRVRVEDKLHRRPVDPSLQHDFLVNELERHPVYTRPASPSISCGTRPLKLLRSLTLLWNKVAIWLSSFDVRGGSSDTYRSKRLSCLIEPIEPLVNEADECVNLRILRRLQRRLSRLRRAPPPGGVRDARERARPNLARVEPASSSALRYASSASSKRPLAHNASPSSVRASASAAAVSLSSVGLTQRDFELGDPQRRPHFPLTRTNDEILVVSPRQPCSYAPIASRYRADSYSSVAS